jgi:uncharacterized protein YeaO (DUF488 family)
MPSGGLASRLVDEDLPHGLSRRAKEMSAVLPPLAATAELKPGFMHQSRGLQGLARRQARQLSGRQKAQFVVQRRGPRLRFAFGHAVMGLSRHATSR